LLLAILVAAQVAKLIPRPRFAVLGAVVALTALVLFAVTPAGVIDLSIGLVLGVGVGLVVPARRITDRRVLGLAALGALAALVNLRLAAVVVVVGAAITIAGRRGTREPVARRAMAVVTAGACCGWAATIRRCNGLAT
jgi:hypothetical protein